MIKGFVDFEMRPLEAEDLQHSQKWFLNPFINQFTSHRAFPMSEWQMRDFWNDIQQHKIIAWGLFTRSGAHIGNVTIQSIDWINRSAELAGVLLDSYSSQGYMTQAMGYAIEHAFNCLNLHRVWLGTPRSNQGMITVAIKLGMAQEGIFREAFAKDGKYQDVIQYGILSHER